MALVAAPAATRVGPGRPSRGLSARVQVVTQPSTRPGPAAVPTLAGAILACRVCSKGSRGQLRRRASATSAAVSADEDEDFDYGAGKDYWDSRYQKEEGKNFDWLGDYEKFREFVERSTATLPDGPLSAKVLDLGCGNAKLAEEMYDDGFQNITALDISEVAIESMRARNAETRPGIDWVVGDAFNLQLEDNSFDLVIDKSTTDAVSCDADHIHENMTRMYGEVFRVLKPGGTFLVFSSVVDVPQAALQLPHLAFDVTEKEIYRPFSKLFAFTATKLSEAPRVTLEEALVKGRAFDQQMAEERQRLRAQREAEAAADERLKESAQSNFGVLD